MLERPFLEPLSSSNNLPVCSEPWLDVGFLLACQAAAHAPLPPFSVAAWTTRCRAFTEKKSEVSSLSTAAEASTLWRPLYHTTILTTKGSSPKKIWRVHSSQPAQVFDTILEKVLPLGWSSSFSDAVLVWISLQPHLQFTKPLTK